MKVNEIIAQELSHEGFAAFGAYANMLSPDGPALGEKPVLFYRDMVQQYLGSATEASLSCGVFYKRDLVITHCECHSTSGEAMLPIDADCLMHVAPACPGDRPDYAAIEVFLVPRGTTVVLRPGVWHHGPYPVDADVSHILYVLPERAYANDCIVHELPAGDRLLITR